MKVYLGIIALFCFMSAAMAQAVPMPLPDNASIEQLFSAAISLFSDFKLLSSQMKVAGVLFLLIAVVKNSMFQPLWAKLGDAKKIAAPVLSLAAFFVMQPKLDLSVVIAAITTGAAASYLADILDLLKKIPGIGSVYVKIIDVIGMLLKKPQA